LNGLLENIQHFFSTFNWLKNAWNTAPYSTSGFTMYDNYHTSYGATPETEQAGAAIAAGDPLLGATGDDRFGGANGDAVDGLGANADGFKEYFPGTDDIRPGRHFRTQADLDNGYALGNHISHYQTLATLFTIKWKGVFRTSIVDVKADLSITVPEWDENDFGGTVANGGANPTHRIDLLFIYTHPVDSDETYISRYKNTTTTPESITSPQLGIVKGAAVVKDKDEVNASFTDADGNRTILGNQADTINGNLGFENATGSFPSPDDLMNLAPLIAADIEDDNLCLVGQSILPVAYIRVNNPGESGPVTINSNDIIDIRPFFRTAELAYNERAGIAAANPPLSIANPAIGKTELWNATDSILHKPLNEFTPPTNNLDLNDHRIITLAAPTDNDHAANKFYVDEEVQALINTPLNEFAPPTDNLNLNNNKILNVDTPESLTDAANMDYVNTTVETLQDSINSLAVKALYKTIIAVQADVPPGTGMGLPIHKITAAPWMSGNIDHTDPNLYDVNAIIPLASATQYYPYTGAPLQETSQQPVSRLINSETYLYPAPYDLTPFTTSPTTFWIDKDNHRIRIPRTSTNDIWEFDISFSLAFAEGSGEANIAWGILEWAPPESGQSDNFPNGNPRRMVNTTQPWNGGSQDRFAIDASEGSEGSNYLSMSGKFYINSGPVGTKLTSFFTDEFRDYTIHIISQPEDTNDSWTDGVILRNLSLSVTRLTTQILAAP